MYEMLRLYDSSLLLQRMGELGLNWYRLGRQAGVDPKTAKKVVLSGSGQPESIQAIAKVLRLRLDEIVKRDQEPGGKRPRRSA